MFEDKDLLEVFEEKKSPMKNFSADIKAEKHGVILSQ